MKIKWFLITDGDWDAARPLVAVRYDDAVEEALGDLGGQVCGIAAHS